MKSGVVVGRCKRCNGWTMFIDPSSPTALKWWRQCERSGDSVSLEHNIEIGPPCKQGDKKPNKRTCEAVAKESK